MIFGQNAFENSHNSFEVIENLLRDSSWDVNHIDKFVKIWSGRIWLTIPRMDKRIEFVLTNVLNAQNPRVDIIKESLKTKISRWKNIEIERIAPIIKRYLVRDNLNVPNQIKHHHEFQEKLGKIGPVLTIWCHYLIEPLSFPPIDKFNYASWRFITHPQEKIPQQVPNNFKYLPFENSGTDYQNYREWFHNILNSWKHGDHNIRDVVNLDKSLMSLGAFILNNYWRGK